MRKYLITASALALLVGGPALAASGDVATPKAEGSMKAAAETSTTSGVAAASTHQQQSEVDLDGLIGRNIENPEGDTVGEVNSVILGKDGKVSAVIIGVGGFLGMGERDVAVKWSELKFSPDDEKIVTNATKDELKQLPEYKFADKKQRGTAFENDMAAAPATTDTTRTPVVVERTTTAPAMAVGKSEVRKDNADVVVKADKGADVDIKKRADGAAVVTTDATRKSAMTDAEATKAKAANARSLDQAGMSAEEVIGQDVVNLKGDEVGEVEDIVIDKDKAAFAVISVGGFLGMGDKNVAVPLSELKLGEDDVIMMSESTEEQLKSMPAYDKDSFKPMDRTHKLQTR